MRGGYELFRIDQVAVRVHGTFTVLAAFLILMAVAAGGTLAEVLSRLSAPLILFVTLLLHEIGHAFVARRMGLTVMDIVLSPVGGAARLLGPIAEPGKEAAVSLAGPAVNLLLAATLGAVTLGTGMETPESISASFRSFFAGTGGVLDRPWLTALLFNLLLGLLNLVPAFPMDGGRVFRALLWMRLGKLKATRIACRLGFWIAVLLIAAPFFMSDDRGWILTVMGFTLMVGAFAERYAIEKSEGALRFGFGIGRFQDLFGMPPRGAGAPGGDAGPAADGFEDLGRPARPATGEIIDVTAESRVLDRREEGRD